MQTYTFIVLTNPSEGSEEEYNRWYEEQHIPDLLKVPGVIGAQRFRMAHDPMQANPLWRYLVIYELQTEDPKEVMDEVLRRVGGETMPMSEALDPHLFAVVYEPVSVGGGAP
ncbi:DUF4286 family protein [Vreelandella titanicae]|uniref:DUF4286 family protein n=1 Tax=Vreelandella titanicae TaxID=664683 RepID=UPI0006884434|nr:DUF4286 family protein [Halomonas titanicae]